MAISKLNKIWKNKGSWKPGDPTWNAETGQEITDKIDEVIDAGIILESGSNENGTYIKFAGGVLICVSSLSLTIESMTAYGSCFTTNLYNSKAFPAAFYGVPKVFGNCLSSGYSGAIYSIKASQSKIDQVTLLRATTAANVNVQIDYLAIGKWK